MVYGASAKPDRKPDTFPKVSNVKASQFFPPGGVKVEGVGCKKKEGRRRYRKSKKREEEIPLASRKSEERKGAGV